MPKKELLDLEYGRSKNVQIIHFRKKANGNAWDYDRGLM